MSALPDAGVNDGDMVRWNTATQNWDAVSFPSIDTIVLYTDQNTSLDQAAETDFQWPDTVNREISEAGVFTVNPGNSIVTTTKFYRVLMFFVQIPYTAGTQRTNHFIRVRRVSDNKMIAQASHGYGRNSGGHDQPSYNASMVEMNVPAGTQYKVTFQREAGTGVQTSDAIDCRWGITGFE